MFGGISNICIHFMWLALSFMYKVHICFTASLGLWVISFARSGSPIAIQYFLPLFAFSCAVTPWYYSFHPFICPTLHTMPLSHFTVSTFHFPPPPRTYAHSVSHPLCASLCGHLTDVSISSRLPLSPSRFLHCPISLALGLRLFPGQQTANAEIVRKIK